MTTVQILQRIARRARTGDFTRLSQDEIMDVLEAYNAASMKAYDALPTYLKRTTQGFTLPAPVTLYNVSVTNGSTQLSSGIFDPSQIGRSVLIAGDPAYNQILGTNSLRNPYMGPTGVAATMIIYGDAIYSTSYPFDRVIGNPKFTDTGFSPLVPMEMSRSEGEWNWLFQDQIGRPQSWWVQYLGNSQGANPVLVMKFAPLPDIAYGIRVDLSFWPLRLLLQDIQAATTINMPDQFLESALIPMGIKELMTKPVWESRSDKDDDRCEQAGIEGLNFCKNQVADPAAPNNKNYCPLGW